MKPFLTIAIIIIILLGFFFMINRTPSSNPTNSTGYAKSTDTGAPSTMTIEDQVRSNITELSPVKSSLGGTFYVTNIEARDGVGTVKYEDGHMAYIADFTYDIGTSGMPIVKSFVVRK